MVQSYPALDPLTSLMVRTTSLATPVAHGPAAFESLARQRQIQSFPAAFPNSACTYSNVFSGFEQASIGDPFQVQANQTWTHELHQLEHQGSVRHVSLSASLGLKTTNIQTRTGSGIDAAQWPSEITAQTPMLSPELGFSPFTNSPETPFSAWCSPLSESASSNFLAHEASRDFGAFDFLDPASFEANALTNVLQSRSNLAAAVANEILTTVITSPCSELPFTGPDPLSVVHPYKWTMEPVKKQAPLTSTGSSCKSPGVFTLPGPNESATIDRRMSVVSAISTTSAADTLCSSVSSPSTDPTDDPTYIPPGFPRFSTMSSSSRHLSELEHAQMSSYLSQTNRIHSMYDKWLPEHDQQLKRLKLENPNKSWAQLGMMLNPVRSHNSVRSRFFSRLIKDDPGLRKVLKRKIGRKVRKEQEVVSLPSFVVSKGGEVKETWEGELAAPESDSATQDSGQGVVEEARLELVDCDVATAEASHQVHEAHLLL
ncbi:hypothetical protein ACM66B_004670 [Microbotryomycetes sp. NB124-2]